MTVYAELVIVHVPDRQNRLIPLPAVVLKAGERFSTIRYHEKDVYIEKQVANDLLTRR